MTGVPATLAMYGELKCDAIAVDRVTLEKSRFSEGVNIS